MNPNASDSLPQSPKSRKLRRWFLGAAALILLALGAIYIDARISAELVIKENRARVGIEIAKLKATRWIRPPLFEPAVEGNGWPILVAAMDEVLNFHPADLASFPSLNQGDKGDPAMLDRILEGMKPAIARIRLALSRTEVDPDYPYEQGMGIKLPEVSKGIRISKIFADAVRHRQGQGRDREAMDLVVMGLGVSQDLAARGFLVHEHVRVSCDSIVREALRTLLADHSLQLAELPGLCSALDRLESRRPRLIDVLRIEHLRVRATLLDPKDLIGGVSDGLPESHRFLFSHRIMSADALQRMDGMMAGFERIERLPEDEREWAAGDWDQAALDTKNPLILLTMPGMKRIVMRHGEARLEARIARVAAALAWHESENGSYPASLSDLVPKYLPVVLEDSLNRRPLSYRATHDTATVFAFGRDGDDDGGRPPSEDAFDGDIVWTLKRRK
jgi:hypothetical protein